MSGYVNFSIKEYFARVNEGKIKQPPRMSDEYPFNELDAAVFSMLIYYPLYLPPSYGKKEPKILRDYYDEILKICKTPQLLRDASNDQDIWTLEHYSEKESRADLNFLELIKKSERYGEVKIEELCAENSDNTDVHASAQFGAATFILPYREEGKTIKVIVFRGTNTSILGWKEDFYFATNFLPKVKKRAVEYVTKAFENCLDTKFVFAGHSKGGHLAVYSFFNIIYSLREKEKEKPLSSIPENIMKNIEKMFYKAGTVSVFNFDGPGMREIELKEFSEFVISKEMIRQFGKWVRVYAPSSTVFSLLFENDLTQETFQFVMSKEKGIYQHSLQTWVVNEKYNFSISCGHAPFHNGTQDDFSKSVTTPIRTFLKQPILWDQNTMRDFIEMVFFILNDGSGDLSLTMNRRTVTDIVKKFTLLSSTRERKFREVTKAFTEALINSFSKGQSREQGYALALTVIINVVVSNDKTLKGIIECVRKPTPDYEKIPVIFNLIIDVLTSSYLTKLPKICNMIISLD